MAVEATISRILLVEDDAADAEVVTRLLSRLRRSEAAPSQFEVVRCDRLEPALQLATSGEVFAILLDLSLPDSDGIATVRRMKQAAPGVPVLVLTGTDDERLGVEAVREGAQDYLLKNDLASHALARAIDFAIERKRASDSQRRLDQRLLTAQKLESLGVLAGGIAHDFNNLLSSVMGYAALALEQIPASASFRHDIEQIERASQRAADLTRQLLAYSGKGRFVVEAVNLSALVIDMSDLVKLSTRGRVSVRYELNHDLPPVEADATQLRQIALNLIGNATEASPQNGAVTVSTGAMRVDHANQAELQLDRPLPNGDYVFLEVSDSGEGMDEETRLRMFDPFFTTKRSGRGLGLAAVLGIVQGHEGAICVSSHVGKGTTIKVVLPASSDAIVTTAHPPSSLRWDATGTILVIDDEEDVRSVAKAILERYGLAVILAEGGHKGVDTFRERHSEIDAVLLDMTMPDLDGASVFEQMRQIQSNVKVVLTSGYNEQDAVRRFAGKGLAGFLAKPIQMRELAEAFRRVLEDDPTATG